MVDATFGHRIDPSERKAFDEAVAHAELVSPPAGAVGRGDAFLLRVAERVGAQVLSNDSFQEFHAEHPWLFDEGRLIGGKPVPGVGWIFTPRSPVRGVRSRGVLGAGTAKAVAGKSGGKTPNDRDDGEASRARRGVAKAVHGGKSPGKRTEVAKAQKAATADKAQKTAKAAKAEKAAKAVKADKAAKAVKAEKAAKAVKADKAAKKAARRRHGHRTHGRSRPGPSCEQSAEITRSAARIEDRLARGCRSRRRQRPCRPRHRYDLSGAAQSRAGGPQRLTCAPRSTWPRWKRSIPTPSPTRRRREPSRRRRTGPPPAVNDPLTFLTFVSEHPIGSTVEGTVSSFVSHGAMVDVGGMQCYVPLAGLALTPPRAAPARSSNAADQRHVRPRGPGPRAPRRRARPPRGRPATPRSLRIPSSPPLPQ